MTIKEQFVERLTQELLNESARGLSNYGPLDVCFMIAAIDQNIASCEEFMKDISTHEYDLNGYDHEEYADGSINVFIVKPNSEGECWVDSHKDYYYHITFSRSDRYWGYCQCTDDMPGYDHEHRCTGSGCDWVAPAFNLTKITNLDGASWQGAERDYWAYEKAFKSKQNNKRSEIENYQKSQEIKNLKAQQQKIAERLKELTA